MARHTLSVLVENKPGVLARISGMFSRRGFNIHSLAVGPTEQDEVSRMTIVVNVETKPLEQVVKQLNKLINVLKIVDVSANALTIEATGSPDKLQALTDLLHQYGVRELVRTGLVALGRGDKAITERPLKLAERTG